MIGNTNSLCILKASDGGGTNKIYVQNQTTLSVEAGRPVLINTTLTDKDLVLPYYSSGNPFYGLVLSNNVFTCCNNIRRYQVGSEQADIIGSTQLYMDSRSYLYMNPNTHKLQAINLNSDYVYEVSPTGSRLVPYFYLDDNLCISNSKLYRCKPIDGSLIQELYQLPITFNVRNNFNGYAYFNSTVFVTNNTSIYQIDVSDLDNITVIRSATGLGSVDYFHGFTGGDVGDYVFGRAGGALVMYRLTETGFALADEENGKPACLCNVALSTGGNTLLYNQITGVLTFLQSNMYFKAFSFNKETKSFTEIGLSEEIAKITPYDTWGILSISPDRNLMTKCFKSAQYQTAMFAYINSNFDGILKAYDSTSFNYRSNSLTGILTGNVDENGLVEVEVIMPKEVNLTVEALPEPDVFQISGGVQ